MTQKSILYTRTGDLGTTSLIGGTRVGKNHPRVETYGTADELSSFIALLLAQPEVESPERDILNAVQQKLFDLGAYLANPSLPSNHQPEAFSSSAVKELEQAIDIIDAQLPPLRAFILPGGTQASAIANICRTVCRRLERNIVSLAENISIDHNVLQYVNRLSDYLFVLGRLLNHRQGASETAWQPNKYNHQNK